jgi:predicted transcriptional regulator
MTKQQVKQDSKESELTKETSLKTDNVTPPKADKKLPAKVTKKAMVQELLQQESGATIQEIADKTGWQHHTVRGHLSMLKKAGHTITNTLKNDTRYYKIA